MGREPPAEVGGKRCSSARHEAEVNGFQVTGMALAGEGGLVAAYQSFAAFRADYPEETDPGLEAQTAFLMGQRFAVPKRDPEKALKKSVEVANTPEFKEHRLALFDWQEQIVEQKIPPKDAGYQDLRDAGEV